MDVKGLKTYGIFDTITIHLHTHARTLHIQYLQISALEEESMAPAIEL